MEAADKTEKAGKPAKKDEAKVRRYVCVQKCFYDGRLFYEKDELETTASDVPDVFEPVNT